jgi:hypothetical protein
MPIGWVWHSTSLRPLRPGSLIRMRRGGCAPTSDIIVVDHSCNIPWFGKEKKLIKISVLLI